MYKSFFRKSNLTIIIIFQILILVSLKNRVGATEKFARFEHFLRQKNVNISQIIIKGILQDTVVIQACPSLNIGL